MSIFSGKGGSKLICMPPGTWTKGPNLARCAGVRPGFAAEGLVPAAAAALPARCGATHLRLRVDAAAVEDAAPPAEEVRVAATAEEADEFARTCCPAPRSWVKASYADRDQRYAAFKPWGSGSLFSRG